MTFTYDGSNFHGYQKQKGLKTVQEELETLLTMIINSIDYFNTASGTFRETVAGQEYTATFATDMTT